MSGRGSESVGVAPGVRGSWAGGGPGGGGSLSSRRRRAGFAKRSSRTVDRSLGILRLVGRKWDVHRHLATVLERLVTFCSRRWSNSTCALRYRRSVLGVGWSLLHPIAMTIVFTTVFSQLFGEGQPLKYAAYALAGLAVWGFLAGCRDRRKPGGVPGERSVHPAKFVAIHSLPHAQAVPRAGQFTPRRSRHRLS